MADESRSFQDVMDALLDMGSEDNDGELVGVEDLQVDATPDESPDESTEETENSDTPSDEDTVEASSDEADDEREAPEATEDSGEETAEPEAEAADTASLPDDTVVGRDDEGNPITLGELRKGYLRQSDYTRKTQEVAEQRRSVTERIEQERSLAKLLVTDQHAREFAELFPDHVESLFKDPAGSVELIQNKEKFAEFVKRVNALDADPELAKAYMKAQGETSAQRELERRVKADEVRNFGASLQKVIEDVGKEYEGVSPDEVAQWLIETSGANLDRIIEANEKNDPLLARDEFAKIATLVVKPDGEGRMAFRTNLLKDRYEVLKMRSTTLTKEQEEHNKKVEQAIEKKAAAPAVTGDAPGATPREKPKYKNLSEFLNREDGPLAL